MEQHKCVISLDACGPIKKIVITTLVKSSTIKHNNDGVATDVMGESGAVQTMRAKVKTRYRNDFYDAVMASGEGEPESNPMRTMLQTMVTMLGRSVFVVTNVSAFLFREDCVVANISLQCNSPVLFCIKGT